MFKHSAIIFRGMIVGELVTHTKEVKVPIMGGDHAVSVETIRLASKQVSPMINAMTDRLAKEAAANAEAGETRKGQ